MDIRTAPSRINQYGVYSRILFFLFLSVSSLLGTACRVQCLLGTKSTLCNVVHFFPLRTYSKEEVKDGK